VSGNDWQTPDWLVSLVVRVAAIALDPCTSPDNPVGAKRILTAESDPDGLTGDWWSIADGGLIFANIPFGRGIGAEFAAKIVHETQRGCEVVALVRGDTSTRWARELINASELVCYPPRIQFKGATGSPNFANSIHYMGPRPTTFTHAFATLGPIVTPITRGRHAQ
jgi:hypothetical protein